MAIPIKDLLSIFLRFLRFGLLAWGGPVAQIAMIKDELVDREKWISPEKFKRVLALYQALPGPEAHELCVYFGMTKAGRLGGFLAGLGFMLPGFLLMLLLSYLYVTYGASVLLPLFLLVPPAVSALITRAAHRIASHILVTKALIYTALISLALTILQVNFLIVFLIAGCFHTLWINQRKYIAIFIVLILSLAALLFSGQVDWHFAGSTNSLFLEGLKAGMLSFGGAYTAIPFLQNSMVDNYAGITANSFLDSIALANVIPAPLVIFGTFLGFLAGSFSGALLITAGIFLPAFSFTLLGHKYLEKLIENKLFHNMLDSISAAVVGMLMVTALQICLITITSPLKAVVFIFAIIWFYRFKQSWSVPVVIFTCGILGCLVSFF